MRGRVLEGVIFANPRWINRYTLVHVNTSNKIFNIQHKKPTTTLESNGKA